MHLGALHLAVYRFNHYDRIVNHDTDSQHECKQCQQVYRKAEHLHKEERTDNGHRYRNSGDERRTKS